jgi:glutamyl-tRNA reductase
MNVELEVAEMHIIVVGLNHKTAPVELREQVSISDIDIDDVLSGFRETHTIHESVVLSTCNRTEVYAVVSSKRAGEDYLTLFLAKRAGVSGDELAPHLYVKTGEAAVVHLFRVVSGLDSLVIGETQILGQVKNAFLQAADVGATGALFNQLFRKAIQVGKRAQSETTIGQHPVSVSYAAVQLAKKIFGDLGGRKAVVLGAGKMSTLAAQYLSAAGVGELMIANRTLSRAEDLARSVGGRAILWEEVASCVATADIVISSTGAKSHVLTADALERTMSKRSSRPIAFIDIAVPRDIDPEIRRFKNVYLYDIDDLEGVVSASLAERERQVARVESMIREALDEFSTWLTEQEVVPLIAAIREKGMAIQASVMESLERKLPNLTERERQILQKHTKSIVNQILRDPIQNMKELAIASGGAKHVEVFAELFGISKDEWQRFSEGETVTAAGHSTHRGFAELVREWSDSFMKERDSSTTQRLHPVLR